ncbi:hypothetical protein DPMN_131358 [Dreissena polymorpha]|uniref:Uncharacterized protein n=1 Tax=Dreissena polymorpha TaxID=45954 RepID=A0A9D4H6U2_DREPO|nr:hypothetical protein DPMN_131358 [Dreissena polymorpha]
MESSHRRIPGAKWATFGKQKLALWDEPNAGLRRPMLTLIRDHKRCWLIQTAGRWPWKSESAKECVTTHLPNQLALKMDGAEASRPIPRPSPQYEPPGSHAATSRRAVAMALKSGP